MAISARNFLAPAIGLALSLVLIFVACGIADNFWPLWTFAVYALAPLPWIVSGFKDDTYSTGVQILPQFGICLGGFILSTLIAMPLVFWRADAIDDELQLALWYVSNALALGSALYLVHKHTSTDDDVGGGMI